MPKYKGVARLITNLELVVEADNAAAARRELVKRSLEDWDEEVESGADFHIDCVMLLEEE